MITTRLQALEASGIRDDDRDRGSEVVLGGFDKLNLPKRGAIAQYEKTLHDITGSPMIQF